MRLRLRALKLLAALRLLFIKLKGLLRLRVHQYSKQALAVRPPRPKFNFANTARVIIALLLVVAGWQFLPLLWNKFLVQAPQSGGELREGVVGSFTNLNPLFAPSNDVDKDATALMFSGLLKIDHDAETVPDLAAKIDVEQDGKVFHVFLRENLKWHDGEPLTAEDVVFTIEALKNPDTASPLRHVWRGVKVEKINDLELKIIAPKIAGFYTNLTQPLVPAHKLKHVPAKNLAFYDEFNLAPTGNGPFAFAGLRRLADGQELKLTKSANYRGEAPYFDGMVLRSYNSELEAVNGLEKREIQAVGGLSSTYLRRALQLPALDDVPMRLAEYTALLMNTESSNLKDLKIRTAVAHAVNRRNIINLEDAERFIVYGPILPGYLGYDASARGPEFNPEKAASLIAAAGYSRDKPLELRLVALAGDFNDAIIESMVAGLAAAGIKVSVERPGAVEYQTSFIIPRNYDLILATENFGYDSDPYIYWHSTQAKDPGLNLSQYNSSKADAALESARRSSDPAFRVKKYQEFQRLVASDVPAVFLYGRYYYYLVSEEIKGTMITDFARIVEPKDRLSHINRWYVNTKWERKKK